MNKYSNVLALLFLINSPAAFADPPALIQMLKLIIAIFG